MSDIFCLMVGGVNLTDEMRTLLFSAARDLCLQGRRSTHITSDDLYADITTQFRVGILGDIVGTVFSAEVASVRGNATVQFIVRNRDLETVDPSDDKGFWTRAPSPQDLWRN